MDKFVAFRDKLTAHFNELIKDAKCLFYVDLDKDKLWETYLDSFPPGTNKVFRERREYDCSVCRQFIKRIGNAVVIKDAEIHTIWEFDTKDATYQPVVDALDEFVKYHIVTDIWFAKDFESTIGCKENYEQTSNGVITWHHFYVDVPQRFRSRRTLGDIQNEYRTRKEVFKRSLEEISIDATDTVLELISQDSLYRGIEWKQALTDFRKLQKKYAKIPDEKKDLWCWETSVSITDVIGRIRNHSMGVLLTDISTGVDLETAVKRYENIVAPTNYKRPKAIFTKKMLEEAKKTITDLGYLDSLGRRFATLDDITINDIIFSNKDSAKRIAGFDIFAEMEKDVKSNPKKFDRVEEISIDKFVSDVVPEAKELEVYFENKHQNNLMSLIAPTNKDAKPMFKWGNNYSWAYNGNITDSMKERVKAAGGKVDGVLRFSIQWNDNPNEWDQNDLDAHCKEPNGYEIFFKQKVDWNTGGNLDVDIINPMKNVPAVENITWPNIPKMSEGKYLFFVHQYSYRGGDHGFRAEIEFDGQIYSFDYPTKVFGTVNVAEVTLKDGSFSIKPLLPTSTSSKEIWGLNTNQFVPVSVLMYSPNYWDAVENKTGNKHYFFMLKGCINENNPNGFFNEYLKPELEKHKRVFEALGSKAKVKDCDDQLSGLGFSSTQRNELVVKVKGATERVLKVKF